jgi:multidrug efflux pump subunit AcrA (membrane-fusion protein)
VVPNPAATTEVRAAFAGRLRSANGKKWPGLASQVKAGDLLGRLEVRGPADRLDLQSKLTEARVKMDGTRKLVIIQKERVKRFESAPASFARSELDTALRDLVDAEIQLATAEAACKQWQDALTALDQAGDLKHITWTMPVTAPADGEITELAVQPEMLIEAGGLIARVVDFRKVLVRVDVPVSLLTPPPKTLDLFVLPATPPAFEGPTNRPEAPPTPAAAPAELVGMAAQTDPTLQAAGYLYHIHDDAKEPGGLALHLWRPGLFVKAYLGVNAAKPVSGLAVPRSAVLFHQGRALVYRRVYPPDPPERGKPPAKFHKFERVEVNVLGRDGDTWIVAGALVDGDLIVTEGAIRLLSMEFRSDVDND